MTYVDSIGYQVTVNFESNSVNYTAQLVNIEGQTFLDLYPDLYCNSWEEVIGSYGVHALPCHVFAKVSFEKDQMTIAFMNYDKLEKLLADGKLNVKHTYVENHYFGDLMEMDEMRLLLLTASIKDLQEFVYDNPEIFTNQEVLKRAAQ